MTRTLERSKALSSLDRLEAKLSKRPGYRQAKAEIQTVAKVAARVLAYRQQEGLSQAALAAKAGLSRKALNEIEGLVNTNPGLKTLEAIAKAMGVGVGSLLS